MRDNTCLWAEDLYDVGLEDEPCKTQVDVLKRDRYGSPTRYCEEHQAVDRDLDRLDDLTDSFVAWRVEKHGG